MGSVQFACDLKKITLCCRARGKWFFVLFCFCLTWGRDSVRICDFELFNDLWSVHRAKPGQQVLEMTETPLPI